MSENCGPCEQAEAVWRAVCDELKLEIRVLDIDQTEGKRLFGRLGLKSLPALILDDELVAVGVQSHDQAVELLKKNLA